MTEQPADADAHVVTAIIVRMIQDGYWCFGEDFLTLDGKVKITSKEARVLERVFGQDGRGWWERVCARPSGSQ